MLTEDSSARREFYRVSIPDAEYVTLRTEIDKYRVREISERGIRFETNASPQLNLDDWVRGTITYDQGSCFNVSGKIIRIERNSETVAADVVIKPENLAMPKVVALQSYLIRTYGDST